VLNRKRELTMLVGSCRSFFSVFQLQQFDVGFCCRITSDLVFSFLDVGKLSNGLLGLSS